MVRMLVIACKYILCAAIAPLFSRTSFNTAGRPQQVTLEPPAREQHRKEDARRGNGQHEDGPLGTEQPVVEQAGHLAHARLQGDRSKGAEDPMAMLAMINEVFSPK